MKRIMIVLGIILIFSGILTGVADGEQKNPAIAQLITQQTTKTVPVTVDGKLYFILTMGSRIDPIACKVIPNSAPTKIYVDTKRCPVSDSDIAQKIGLIDLARIWQQNIGSPENLYKKQTEVAERWQIYAQIEFEDAIVKAIPMGLVGALTKAIVNIIKETVSDPMTELRDNVAEKGFWETQNNYLAAQKIAGKEISDYDLARKYLEHYWEGEAYERTVFHLLDKINEVYKNKIDRIGEYLLKKLPTLLEKGGEAFALLGFVEFVHEGKKATDLEWEHNDTVNEELRQVQEKLSKLHEVTGYTLRLAQGCRVSEDGLVTALVIDRSGSMRGEKLCQAQEAAYVYVDTSPEENDLVSLIAFSADAESITPPLPIVVGRETLKKNILSLSSEGNTNVGAGLTIALGHLSSCAQKNKTAVLLSDGRHNTGTYKPEVTEFQKRGWQIHTVAFGRNADQETLTWIANQTGGSFFPANLFDIVSVYQKINIQAHNGSVFHSYNDFIHPRERLTYNIPVEPDMKKVGFFTNWQGSRMETVLFSPNRTVINRSNISNWGRFVEGETHNLFEIDNPQSGNWQALITGYNLPPQGEQINFHSFCQSDIFSNILGFQPNYSLNQQVRIGVRLAEVIDGRLLPLRGAQVRAEIKKPSLSLKRFTSDIRRKRLQPEHLVGVFREMSGFTRKIVLFDDGLHGDVYPGDGIYANSYDETTINGPYLVTIDCHGYTSQGRIVNRTLQESFQVGSIEKNSFTISEFLGLINQQGIGRQIPRQERKKTKERATEEIINSLLNQLFKKR